MLAFPLLGGLGIGNGDNEEETDKTKKQIVIKQTLQQHLHQHQYQIPVEVQAPFTYQPTTEKVYAPQFLIHSPYAKAETGVTQEATSSIDLLLKQAQDLLAKQQASQEASQEATATISEDETAAQSLLGVVVILAGLGAVGYWGYKELDKKKIKKGGLKQK